MELNRLTGEIIGGAIEVHRELGGPGLLEDIYEQAFVRELALRGLSVKQQIPVPVLYKGVEIKKPLYLDLLVEGLIIVEVKATEKHNPIFEAQLLTYLRLTGLNLGLVINFGEKQLRQGIHRVVNKLKEN
ncbi:MAG TPA: GxxExxY protein [Geobacterales bacterium]|nr:GxxExxY protein [Geobacterales bacterium]